jgi:sugar lactone lactonase YvrE
VIADANENTFYAAISNIDFEIGDGNPAAVAIRFHGAQHCFLSHMDFHVGSGLAALTEIGNEAEDLHFFGGRYGILTDMTSPGWQFTLIDSEFQGQRDAAIREHGAGMTLIRDSFRDVPVGVEIDKDYFDQLWIKDGRFENVSGAAVLAGKEKNPLTEIGIENAVMKNVPVVAQFRESGAKVAGKGPIYRVANFNYGLIIPSEGKMGAIGTLYNAAPLAAMPAPMAKAIPALPPTSEWVSVLTLGVKGDGTTDDTAAIQKAIDQHRVLYFPSGRYLINDTLALKADTALIGLHPTATQIILGENTPAFAGVGGPLAVISAPSGGRNILSGIGVSTGNINPRAVGVLWKAGETSLIDDVRISGPAGGNIAWDQQYPSIWINQGGGTFADIWTPNTNAQAGFFVSDTKIPGHVYELSNEHHVRNEIKLDHVENWDINAPQTEEEQLDSPEALSLEIAWCKNITIANYHAYRVTRSRAPYASAARVYNSSGIHFRNVHVNAESGIPICDANGCATYLRISKYPYENAVQDVTHHLETREREFAALDIPAAPVKPVAAAAVAVLEPGATVRKLEEGFFSISGAAVDAAGKLYFVDRHQQRIYGWSVGEGLTIERDSPLNPDNLAFDKAGNLIVFSFSGPEAVVYTFRPGSPKDQVTVLAPQAAQPHPNAKVVLPVNYWNNGEFRDHLDLDTLVSKTLAQMFQEDVTAPKTKEYVSPDGSTVVPAFRIFQQAAQDIPGGWHFSDTLDTYGFVSGKPGDHIYVSNSSEDITYRALVKADGTLGDLQPFAQRGGECVAVDAKGNVYVANGQVFVYDPTGKQIGEIDVPERPLDLVFGGPDGRTLFILAHHALFEVKVRG